MLRRQRRLYKSHERQFKVEGKQSSADSRNLSDKLKNMNTLILVETLISANSEQRHNGKISETNETCK